MANAADTPSVPLDIKHEPDQNRFSIALEGQTDPAVLRYRKNQVDGVDVLDMYSTFVPESMRGMGIAGKLVKFGFAYARDNGNKVIPTCPYIPVYLKKNPTENDVILEQ